MAAKILQIDGSWIPGISAYSCTLEDIDSEDTTRTESGKMVRKVIRKKVKKLSFTFKITDPQVTALCEKIAGDTVTMTVFCPADTTASGYYATAEFYISKITVQLVQLGKENWWEVSCHAIEV